MVLDADEPEPALVGGAHERTYPVELVREGNDRDADFERPRGHNCGPYGVRDRPARRPQWPPPIATRPCKGRLRDEPPAKIE
jgi:hypothetical protein